MNKIIHIDASDGTPIYVQLERSIRAAIATGRIRPGEQLPTVRQLAVELRINANTVAKVYAELERSDVVETRRGVGTFVKESLPATPKRERESRLRRAADHFIAEMAAHGYSLDELIDHLNSRRSPGE
jgi:GntR family transcriptional regulator